MEMNIKVLKKLRDVDIPNHGSLAFFKDWNNFMAEEGYWGLETYSGPHSGLLGAFKRGTLYRERYGHLWDKQSKMPIFTSSSERIIQTARKFGEGFLGWNYTDSAAVNIILETEDQGANSLTPVCVGIFKNEACNTTLNHPEKVNPQLKIATKRLNDEYEGFNLNYSDINDLFMMTAYELNTKSWSPWINVFTQDEWVGFEYSKDLYFYYCSGPGAEFTLPAGSVWANATLQLLKAGPNGDTLPTYWTFSHDTDITKMLAAIGLTWPTDPKLPYDGIIPFYNQYKATEITPMNTHLVLERLQCDETAISKKGVYIRAVLNEAVVPWPECQDGPGFSCSLKGYENIVQKHYHEFVKKCKIPKDWPQYLDFFWNYNTTGEMNFREGYIPWQEGVWKKYSEYKADNN